VKKNGDEIYAHVEELLRMICFKIRVQGRIALKDYSITPAQFDLMQRTYFDGPQTMTKLSQMLGIAKSTTTGLVMRLERDGFLRRKQGEEDKRVAMVEITELGSEVIRSVIKRRVDYIKEIMEKFPLDTSDRIYHSLIELSSVIEER